MSLIELVIAMAVITIAILGLLSALTSNINLTDSNRELALAINAARSMTETLQDYPTYSQIFSAYSGTNASFDVSELSPITGAPNGKPGQIVFPGSGGMLLENVTDSNLGMPRSLNGDAVIDGNNHAGDYTILPVTIRIEWQTKTGARKYEIHTILVAK
jgi:hypothetical protein